MSSTASNIQFIIDQLQRIMDNAKTSKVFMWALKLQSHYKELLVKTSVPDGLKTAERRKDD